jgi:hypothetical protein
VSHRRRWWKTDTVGQDVEVSDELDTPASRRQKGSRQAEFDAAPFAYVVMYPHQFDERIDRLTTLAMLWFLLLMNRVDTFCSAVRRLGAWPGLARNEVTGVIAKFAVQVKTVWRDKVDVSTELLHRQDLLGEHHGRDVIDRQTAPWIPPLRMPLASRLLHPARRRPVRP